MLPVEGTPWTIVCIPLWICRSGWLRMYFVHVQKWSVFLPSLLPFFVRYVTYETSVSRLCAQERSSSFLSLVRSYIMRYDVQVMRPIRNTGVHEGVVFLYLLRNISRYWSLGYAVVIESIAVQKYSVRSSRSRNDRFSFVLGSGTLSAPE